MNRPGDLLGATQRLKRATRELQHQWDSTKMEWNDAATRQFETKYLEPILPTLRLFLAATSELEDIYRQAINECRDRDKGELEA